MQFCPDLQTAGGLLLPPGLTSPISLAGLPSSGDAGLDRPLERASSRKFVLFQLSVSRLRSSQEGKVPENLEWETQQGNVNQEKPNQVAAEVFCWEGHQQCFSAAPPDRIRNEGGKMNSKERFDSPAGRCCHLRGQRGRGEERCTCHQHCRALL